MRLALGHNRCLISDEGCAIFMVEAETTIPVKTLVTGATGLVGVHTVAELVSHGMGVRVLVRSPEKLLHCLEPFNITTELVEIVEGDISNTSALASYIDGCDALVHCAGIFSNDLSDRSKLQKINVDATRNILTQAHQQKLDPIIYLSSYLALFPPDGNIMTGDDTVKSPRAMYAGTKAEAERIARTLQDQGAPVVSVYPGSIQGPNDPTYGIGSQLLEQAVKTRKMLVTEGGRGFTDVRDLAQLIRKALVKGRGAKRYMFGGYFLEHREVLQLLANLSGRDIKPINVPGSVLRGIGSTIDLLSKLTGKSYMLTREAAEVLTRSVPCDDSPAIDELELELVGCEKSFSDLLSWMKSSGKLR